MLKGRKCPKCEERTTVNPCDKCGWDSTNEEYIDEEIQ